MNNYFQFKRKEVVYHRTKLCDQGIQADEEKVKAIKLIIFLNHDVFFILLFFRIVYSLNHILLC